VDGQQAGQLVDRPRVVVDLKRIAELGSYSAGSKFAMLLPCV